MMSRNVIAATGLLAVLAACSTAAAPAAGAPADLLSHRAAYRLTLAKPSGSPSPGTGMESVRGGLVLEWRADCTGWLSQQRLGFVAKPSEGADVTQDVRFSSWEATDFTQLRFQVRTFEDGKEKEAVSGAAALASPGGKGEVQYTQPEASRVELPQGTLFPTEPVRHLIKAARSGERIVNNYVFDGSGAEALNLVTAVIGQGVQAARDDGTPEQRWPVHLSYYKVDDADALPDFQIRFNLSEIGVLHDIVLDYGEFALKGELEKLVPLGEPKCN
jgi:hypothetical protein